MILVDNLLMTHMDYAIMPLHLQKRLNGNGSQFLGVFVDLRCMKRRKINVSSGLDQDYSRYFLSQILRLNLFLVE